MINLKDSINGKETPENENPKKIVNIVEKILNFSKQQNIKGHSPDLACVAGVAKVYNRKVFELRHIKILNPKQMPQKLPTVLAEVRPSNKSENILNETRKIIYSLYSLYWKKEVTKKVYNKIMNLIKL